MAAARPPTEVDGLYIRVAEEGLRCVLEHHPASFQHQPPMSQAERHARVLLHQYHAQSLLLIEHAQGGKDLFDDNRSEPHRRLVQQQEARFCHERPAHGQHLLLAPRECTRLLATALLEAREQSVDLAELVSERAPPPATAVRPQLQVLLHRHGTEQLPALGHLYQPLAHDAFHAHSGQFHAAELHTARPRRHDAGHGLEQRALSGAVGPYHSDDLPLGRPQVHAVQHRDTVIAGPEAADGQHQSSPR